MLIVPARFNGPPRSAHGGYICGVLARLASDVLGGPVAVTLHEPPPLDTELRVEPGRRRLHLWHGDRLLASAAPTGHRPTDVDPVEPELAKEAAQGYPGYTSHPFPTCFVCGVQRPDGLGLAPGPVPGRAGTVADRWTPDDSMTGPDGLVRPEILWSVLDCPSGWTTGPLTTPRVLSWMTAEVCHRPTAGTLSVVTAHLVGDDGHVTTNTSTLRDELGTVLARATTRWIMLGAR
jgi:hypothetical protein